MTDELPASRRIRVSWIEPPSRPDEETLSRLREAVGSIPRVREAWLVGQRVTPDDGSKAYETTDVAVVLDPPLTVETRDEALAVIHELTEQLSASGFGSGKKQGWLFVNEDTIRAHQDVAERISPVQLG